jgi:hypothetical protein
MEEEHKIEYEYTTADKETQSIEETEIELEPFNMVVPLGYGLVAPSVGRLSEDIDSFGGKKDDLIISYYLMKERLKPGENIPQEVRDNIDKLNCVNLIITKEYAKGLKEILENYINEA